MGTSEAIAERAMELARAGSSGEAAVSDLREASLGRRVAVVMARQYLEDSAQDADTSAAVELLDLTLQTSDWAS